MKKKRIISFALVLTMLFSLTATPAFAADGGEKVKTFFQDVLTKTIGFVMETLTGAINNSLSDKNAVTAEKDFELTDFYPGTKTLLKEPAKGARWALGYDTQSLVPENRDEYNLYLGGFIDAKNGFSNKVKDVYDDMKVRTIALSDSSGRGTSVFATIDCIGMTNTDIREIRASLSDFAKENGVNSINIFATHCHSCIDTQGLWTDNVKTIFKNMLSAYSGFGSPKKGTDEKYMKFLYEKVGLSIKNAVSSMKTGELTISKKDIGAEYFNNKNRKNATAVMSDLTKFTFTPDDGSTPTIIANMAAHPDIVGLPTDQDDSNGQVLSGDYVYYIGETLEKAGYNFMFFNGAICGIYIGRDPSNDNVELERRVDISVRYGREIGRILLAMNMTEEEIKNDPFLSVTGDSEEDMNRAGYTLWYKNWKPVEEKKVEPLLNVVVKSVRPTVTNNVILYAGKLRLVNHTMLKGDDGKIKVATEIGFVQIGSQKVVMMPGEICQDLVAGGASLTKEGSISHSEFSGKTVYELFGEDTIVFGLANDAIGYVVPDNDYCMGLVFNHYQETLSLGKGTASFLMGEYAALAKEVG
ncbi:MAG: TrbC/VirB2 family protein [Clostridia bacterium]|nr:TrbC/VirB2 family protein [Clostridia bacterium]